MAKPVITELRRSLEPVTADPFIAEFAAIRAPSPPVSTAGIERELPATTDLPKAKRQPESRAKPV